MDTRRPFVRRRLKTLTRGALYPILRRHQLNWQCAATRSPTVSPRLLHWQALLAAATSRAAGRQRRITLMPPTRTNRSPGNYKTGARALKRKRVHNGLALRVLQVVFAECRRRWSDRSCWHLQKKKKKKKAYSSPLWALNASQVAFHQKFASSDNSVALHFDRKCLTNGRWEREKREKEKVRKMKSNLLKEHLPYIISSEWLLSGSMSSIAGGSVVERKKKTLMWKKESTGSFIYWLFKGNFGAPLTGMIKWIFPYSTHSAIPK